MQNRRIGDQIGALLAGAYSLNSDSEISLEQALEWVNKQDWSEQQIIAESMADERRCLDVIMTHIENITPSLKLSVYEIIQSLFKPDDDGWGGTTPADAKTENDLVLERIGIRYFRETRMIFISDSHDKLKQIFGESSYSSSWSRLLHRIPGAEKKGSMRFLGTTTRATGIPQDIIFTDTNVETTNL
jgi:putative DNA primase/helicase